MKFMTLATIVALASAEVVFVTQTNVVTVYANANGDTATETIAAVPAETPAVADNDEVKVVVVSQGVAALAAAQNTLVTKPSPTEQAPAPASSAPSDNNNGGTPGAQDPSWASAILSAHNEKRAAHSASALTWDSKLASYAQNYANNYDCSGSLVHSGGPYGENLALGYSSGVAALQAWYDEGNNFNYASPSLDHFTQVIWKSTTQLGCAYKDCSAENWGQYVICSYNPAGNVIGQTSANLS